MATRLTRDEKLYQALGVVEAAIDRAKKNYSKQSRFTDPQSFINSFYRWIKDAELEQVPYSSNSQKRDAWLRKFWKKNPHLSGVINSVISIDKNRGWWLTGGRNQVLRFDRILNEAEDGAGWREYMSLEALSYYTSDLGAVSEVGREFDGGPLRALYHVDPVACRLTGNPVAPLAYTDSNRRETNWLPGDFFRVCSMPSDDQAFNKLGFCAVSRAYELVMILISVLNHDLEMLGGKAPRGLLLLQNITQEQWDDAMAMRAAIRTQKESEYYGLIDVIAHMGTEPPDAKLFALSQLPNGFDLQTTTDLMMYGIALCFGYAPLEFWPVNVGALGRGRESEIQHTTGTGKGGKDFTLGFQQQLQRQLPETLLWQFEERDADGEIKDAQVEKAWSDVAALLIEKGILSADETRQYLVDKGIIPAEWTLVEEDATADDEGESTAAEDEPDEASADDEGETRMRRLKERVLDHEQVRRAIVQYPKEPIVRRHSSGREIILWQSGDEALKRRSWAIPEKLEALPEVRRPRLIRAATVLNEGDDVEITDEDVEEAIAEGAERVDQRFADLLEAGVEGDDAGT